MPIAPGQAIANSRVFWAAGGSGGGSNPAEIPPLVLGPNPTIGDENTAYQYQFNSYGTLPITFNVVAGSIPTGLTLDSTTGYMQGTPTNGALYTFTLRAENAYGFADVPFSILINGTTPSLFYYTYPELGFLAYNQAVSFPITMTGSTPMYTFELQAPAATPPYSPGTPDGMTFNLDTGTLAGTPEASSVSQCLRMGIRANNYFGWGGTLVVTFLVYAPTYWGEWVGAVPGTFTENDILNVLTDNGTPGPRTSNLFSISLDDGVFVGPIYDDGVFAWPLTGAPRRRVFAIPHAATLTHLTPSAYGPYDYDLGITSPLVPLTTPFPGVYQTLTIDGLDYDIFVFQSDTTTALNMVFYGFPL